MTPDEAREMIRAGIEYLGDVDGYSRDDLASLTEQMIDDLFAEVNDV